MKTLRQYIVAALLVIGLIGVPTLITASAYAAPGDEILNGASGASGEARNDAKLSADFEKVVNFILYVLGAVAIIMIIFGGFRYVVSGGDGSAITAAKNTILYAVIGLIVALLAYAIVNFVIGEIKA